MNALFPFDSLVHGQYQIGLVVAVAIGFGFGFVLERAGFGRADKLAAQFYLHDMRVFKVMFTGIVTAMLGLVIAAGLGLADLRAISQAVASETYWVPMIVGGFLLGVGFIVSGYCPGTSLVASASGNLDGIMAFAGVVVGTLIYGEVFPAIREFHFAGAAGQVFLDDVFGMNPALLAAIVAIAAVAMFVGAEKVEHIVGAKKSATPGEKPGPVRRFAFGTIGALAATAVIVMVVPATLGATATSIGTIDAETLAHRVVESPWTIRVIDLRAAETCAASHVPGAECVGPNGLADLGLADDAGARELVLVGDAEMSPPQNVAYSGRVAMLAGGFGAWHAFALEAPAESPGADWTSAEWDRYRFRTALNGALTGAAAAPVAAAPTGAVVAAPKKKKAGGCS
ncbi:MAG: YeeE/YedE family protein [Deltaproteobacteria bacterium]|nr:YeeE/YedE family protein [Deltaproteobacteria bacterium]